MSLKIEQSASEESEESWAWSVWVDGPESELDSVASVEYILHPTFPNPIVRVTQREMKFRLDSSGWGEFEIHAHVTTKDGRRLHLKHWLKLAERAPAKPGAWEKRVVFISAGVADGQWEEAVRDAFEHRGVDVLTSRDVPSGVPVETAINSTIDKADVVVGIFTDKPAAWAERELMKAVDRDVSVVPLAVGAGAKVPPHLHSVQALRIPDARDVDAAIGLIVDELRAPRPSLPS
jgi:hypothetical protein